MTTLHKYVGSININSNDYIDSNELEVWQKCDFKGEEERCNNLSKGHGMWGFHGKHLCQECMGRGRGKKDLLTQEEKERQERQERHKKERQERKEMYNSMVKEYTDKGLTLKQAQMLVSADLKGISNHKKKIWDNK